MYTALNSDPSDPDVIITLDISNAFNALCRQLTLDVLGGKVPVMTHAGLAAFADDGQAVQSPSRC